MAIDPGLLRDAIAAHFGVHHFDADSYLEKLFEFSQELPGLDGQNARTLITAHLSQLVPIPGGTASVLDALGAGRISGSLAGLAGQYDAACSDAELLNPRIIERICRRLEMLAVAEPPEKPIDLSNYQRMQRFLFWLAATQRWPRTRTVFRRGLPQGLMAAIEARQPRPATTPPRGETGRDPLPAVVRQAFEQWPSMLSLLQAHQRNLDLPFDDLLEGWQRAAADFDEFERLFRHAGL